MADIMILVILAVIIGAAVRYLIKAKKSGVHCVGCPDGGCCSKAGAGECSCGKGETDGDK